MIKQIEIFTVKKLISKLKKLDPEAMIMMSQDDEGNGFRFMTSAESISKEDMKYLELDHWQSEIMEAHKDKEAIILW